jgi:hypothetical protein
MLQINELWLILYGYSTVKKEIEFSTIPDCLTSAQKLNQPYGR